MSDNAKKGSEAKFYPFTNITIDKALTIAKMTNDNHGANTILTQKTIDRLNAIAPLFKEAGLNVGAKKAGFLTLRAQKDKARTDTALYTSHFVQVFNLGAKRGKYSFADRAHFQLDVSSEALPNLKGERNIEIAANFVVTGEAARIAAGKEAVTNPSGAEVEAVYNNFMQLTGLVSNADDVYGKAQKALRALRKEARAVVKKVWNEVETYYGEGDRERMRKHAREWGVKYARKGGEKILKGSITDAATGLPVVAVKVKFENGNNKTVSNMEGRFTLVTNLLHKQTLLATRSGYHSAQVVIELKEGEENVCVVKMEREAE